MKKNNMVKVHFINGEVMEIKEDASIPVGNKLVYVYTEKYDEMLLIRNKEGRVTGGIPRKNILFIESSEFEETDNE